MSDIKATADAMDKIVDLAAKVYESCDTDVDNSYRLGKIVGIAEAVRLQCEQRGPVTRGPDNGRGIQSEGGAI